MRKARVRTESMVQRFAAKPISEGFDLWDCGYPFGALRLFMFKAESVPPFQLGPCIDAIAEISSYMGNTDDAKEQFTLAASKYRILQQPILSELMSIKLEDLTNGPRAALEQLEVYLANQDPERNGGGSTADTKTRSALARSYAYLAELYLAASDDANNTQKTATTSAATEPPPPPTKEKMEASTKAIELATLAVTLGWDRVHLGYDTLGTAYEEAGMLEKAMGAYHSALEHCPRFVAGIEHLIEVKRLLGFSSKDLLPLINQAIAAHPKPHLLRDKAFILSELMGDAEALDFLETLLKSPPLEEMECVSCERGGPTVATLLKAKAAVLADAERFQEALEAAQAAIKACPDDKEAEAILLDIQETMNA